MAGSGAFGPIDLSKTVVRGWSGGAQMVSWMVQVMAEQPGVFPGVTMAVSDVTVTNLSPIHVLFCLG